jgi:disulfide bond formation protein DsbB
VLGYRPCPLCLEQRYQYYFGIPLAVVILLGESVGSRRRILLVALAVIAGLMLWNAGLAGYHAGVEWKWWPGPNTCGGAPDLGGGGNLLKQLQSINVVRCDEAAWTFLGLSLAGYNMLISLARAVAVGIWPAARRRNRSAFVNDRCLRSCPRPQAASVGPGSSSRV